MINSNKTTLPGRPAGLREQAGIKPKLLLWIKRIGFWGFLFFLVKGLVWLAVGYWILK